MYIQFPRQMLFILTFLIQPYVQMNWVKNFSVLSHKTRFLQQYLVKTTTCYVQANNLNFIQSHHQLQDTLFGHVRSVAKLTSSASCSWWWLCYMSKHTFWSSACVAKPRSSASCSWWWLCYMSKRTLCTSACVLNILILAKMSKVM